MKPLLLTGLVAKSSASGARTMVWFSQSPTPTLRFHQFCVGFIQCAVKFLERARRTILSPSLALGCIFAWFSPDSAHTVMYKYPPTKISKYLSVVQHNRKTLNNFRTQRKSDSACDLIRHFKWEGFCHDEVRSVMVFRNCGCNRNVLAQKDTSTTKNSHPNAMAPI